MNLPDAVAVILWVGVTAYAVFGGADFGVGFWDLLAGGDEKGARPRALVDIAIGPVWEANHVWLIFCLVVLWTAFSTAFAAIMTTLFVPLSLALLGIVLRGSGFAYRHATTSLASRRLFGAIFAISSVITPFFLGTIAGAIASGRVPTAGEPNPGIDAWLNPTSLLGGVLAVVACGFLAATYLVHDAHRLGADDLVDYFVLRTRITGVVVGVVALVGVFVIRADAEYLFEGLTGSAVPFIGISAIGGIGAMALIGSRPALARVFAAGAVATVIWGWGVAQAPYLLPEDLTIRDAASSDPTLWSVVIVLGIAVAVVFPSLYLLYRLDDRRLLDGETLDEIAAENRARPASAGS